MTREVLYKGKGKRGEGWQVGSYWVTNKTTYCFTGDYVGHPGHPENTEHYILFDRMTDWGLPNQKLKLEIDPETLCVFTNKLDKNKTRIFEHDYVYGYDCGLDEELLYQVVVYPDGSYRLWRKQGLEYVLYYCNSEDLRVAGNRFDNKELEKEL